MKSSGELAVLFLRQFDVPISWKERLFYFQRDYAIFISLRCINFCPTEYEGFEKEPFVEKYTDYWPIEKEVIWSKTLPSWLARQKYWMKRKILLKSISTLSKDLFIWRKLAQLGRLSHLGKIIFVPRSMEKDCFDYGVLILFIGSQTAALTSFFINTVRC